MQYDYQKRIASPNCFFWVAVWRPLLSTASYSCMICTAVANFILTNSEMTMCSALAGLYCSPTLLSMRCRHHTAYRKYHHMPALTFVNLSQSSTYCMKIYFPIPDAHNGRVIVVLFFHMEHIMKTIPIFEKGKLNKFIFSSISSSSEALNISRINLYGWDTTIWSHYNEVWNDVWKIGHQ